MEEIEIRALPEDKRRRLLALAVQLCEIDDCQGLCTNCESEAFNVEPDAAKYRCEDCRAYGVYGAQQLVIMLAF